MMHFNLNTEFSTKKIAPKIPRVSVHKRDCLKFTVAFNFLILMCDNGGGRFVYLHKPSFLLGIEEALRLRYLCKKSMMVMYCLPD